MMQTIVKRCPIQAEGCAIQQTLDVDANAYRRWQEGQYVQDAFPELSADQREMLITGICGSCWEGLR